MPQHCPILFLKLWVKNPFCDSRWKIGGAVPHVLRALTPGTCRGQPARVVGVEAAEIRVSEQDPFRKWREALSVEILPDSQSGERKVPPLGCR